MIESALIRLFAAGWCITRRVAPPVDDGAALRIEVGLPDERRRFVFPDQFIQMTEVAARIDEPLVLLKAPMPEAAMRALLPRHWQVERTGTMMTTPDLRAEPPIVPHGHHLEITEEDDVVIACIISPDGAAIAQGKLVVMGEWALHDRISVEEAYRRAGLGRAIMRGIGTAAVRRGARHGILAATDMGRALYLSMGWQAQAPWTTARINR